MATRSRAVAKTKGGGAVAAYDYGEHAGAGFEGTTQADLSIPFIAILQALSPQVLEKNPPGSEIGKLYNTVTRDLYTGADGVPFLPVHSEHVFVEWVPRKKGGGLVAVHATDSKVVADAIADNDGKKFGKLKVGENDLIETYYVYGLLLDPSGTSQNGFAVASFSSTKIKPYRDWFTAMYTLKGRPPLFANRALLKTVEQKNEEGTFYNFQVEPLKGNWAESLINPASEGDLLKEAVEFQKMVVSGMAKADFASQNAAGGEGAGPAGGGDAVPF